MYAIYNLRDIIDEEPIHYIPRIVGWILKPREASMSDATRLSREGGEEDSINKPGIHRKRRGPVRGGSALTRNRPNRPLIYL
jgi:hypothetical protein